MIEIYTDGSYYRDNRELPLNKICGGVGIVMRLFDSQYIDEVVSEEYYAFRYSYQNLIDKIAMKDGIYQCFENISSTLTECIGLTEGIKLIENLPLSDTIKIYLDDSFLAKMLKTYIDLVNQDKDITDSQYNGCILCMLDELLQRNNDLLNRLEVYHVKSHRNNKYNNMADYLASYRSKPLDRIIDLLIRNTEITNINDRKQYFLYLQNLKNTTNENG